MAEELLETSSAAERLRLGAERLGVALDQRQRDLMMQYLELMMRWGAAFNLTAVRDLGQMVDSHLLDCLSIVPIVDELGGGHWLDAGSGAGLPGIPLAIARPALDVTTVDAVHKKIAFQTQVKGSLKLANVHPIHARMQALTLAKNVDVAVFRAFAPLAEGLDEVAPHLQAGGRVVAMKGDLKDDELKQVGDAWRIDAVRPLQVPELDARRCAVLLTRR